MLITVFKSKIHRVRVTETELNYIGSITIDEALMDAAGIVEGEKVQICNVNNGERTETYAIPGERGSGQVCVNGPGARRAGVGDVLIIMAYGHVELDKAKEVQPQLVFPDENNQIS